MNAMKDTFDLLDVIALTADLPERGLTRGQVGTIVEKLGTGVYEVEFSDDEGRTYASLALRPDQMMALHYKPVKAA
jgi:hypothetical protein